MKPFKNHPELYTEENASSEELLLADILQQFEGRGLVPSKFWDKKDERCALGALAEDDEFWGRARHRLRLEVRFDAWDGGEIDYPLDHALEASWRVLHDKDTDRE